MFDAFIAIDWSGAKSNYARKLQVAVCEPGTRAPRLVQPRGGWSRASVLGYLQDHWFTRRALIGFDFSFAPPFLDAGAYLPQLGLRRARPFWAYVDSHCSDDDLGAASFIEQRHPQQFYRGAVSGRKAPYQRWRRCEQVFNQAGGGKASSIFDTVGAAQVAKASFAGMRLLHRIGTDAAIWPFDPRPSAGSGGAVVVELYCRAFIKMAVGGGTKLRDSAALNHALAQLGSGRASRMRAISDDKTDAIIASAGLRAIAAHESYWAPPPLSAKVAQTEGWTFGVGGLP